MKLDPAPLISQSLRLHILPESNNGEESCREDPKRLEEEQDTILVTYGS
jgi:hypothetical protein